METIEIKIYNHESDETIIVNSVEELIAFINEVDDVFSYHLERIA